MTPFERALLRTGAVILLVYLLSAAAWNGWVLAQQTIVQLITLERRALTAEAQLKAAQDELARLRPPAPSPAVPAKAKP
jgi:hypothetical protein